MHGMAPQLAEIEAIAASVKSAPPLADILICLPATLIARAGETTAGWIDAGGEDCSAEVSGAFTGDISAEMLKGAGAAAVIVGHSERRQHHAETDAIVAAKAKAAQRAGLLAIICIGETQSQRLNGKALSVCGDQIARSVPSGMTASAVAIRLRARLLSGRKGDRVCARLGANRGISGSSLQRRPAAPTPTGEGADPGVGAPDNRVIGVRSGRRSGDTIFKRIIIWNWG